MLYHDVGGLAVLVVFRKVLCSPESQSLVERNGPCIAFAHLEADEGDGLFPQERHDALHERLADAEVSAVVLDGDGEDVPLLLIVDGDEKPLDAADVGHEKGLAVVGIEEVDEVWGIRELEHRILDLKDLEQVASAVNTARNRASKST